jgi:AAA domain, putative AbiEii toxin, Type IV TA system
MVSTSVSFSLPLPWEGQSFSLGTVGQITFLVGPNGSGKSRFAAALRDHLPNTRLLGTDRLAGMEATGAGLRNIHGDHFGNGFAKSTFPQLKSLATQGSGIDAIILLEERLDLSIQVEATLSHLFNRQITLDWDSGNLVARATLGSNGVSYRLDRDECHGIKELLVLLTHVYDDRHDFLIIDEPELNLHPQYQAFLLQEIRKVACNPVQGAKRKTVFLVTHSPFILDLRTVEDVQSILSFDLAHSIPRRIAPMDAAEIARLAMFVPRLNARHKQLFFSDNPVFVEGVLDAQLVEAMQAARGVSIAGAGSCIIDAGGCEEVNKYLDLCLAFGKRAHFLYDLDSLFGGNPRACIKGDGTVEDFLLAAGVGNDFGKYCGELDARLTLAIDDLLKEGSVPDALARLVDFLKELGPRQNWTPKTWARGRVAVLTAISRLKTAVISRVREGLVPEIEGRLKQIVVALGSRNVHLLAGGTIERYLPAYGGDFYVLSDEAKRQAVTDEIGEMSKQMTPTALLDRYGELYENICLLPSKMGVGVDTVLRRYLSGYIHDLQSIVVTHPEWSLEEIRRRLNVMQVSATKVFAIADWNRGKGNDFSATITVSKMLGQEERRVRIDQ